ncbi:MAG: hypothetical protein A2341_18415 [Deltaproteobacteria bacterium RIFOXYB12_FULL_58_9]|nr:MAG: hypothetical protein A2341_18415 [Deltaproteobacteria bacterium RIFOXYB12_FULL_58_9]
MKRIGVLLLLLCMTTLPSVDSRGAGEVQPSQDSHTVEPGDTLWDVTARVFGDPFLWPRVWSYNPEISNPNWIYPGDVIRFYPSREPLPSRTELIADRREMPQEEEAVEQYEEPEEGPAVELVNTAPADRAPARQVNRFVGLFVTPKELAEAGTLTNGRDDKMLFATGDTVYLSFPKDKQPKPGERYMIYRTLGRVVHPRTKEPYGFMTQVTGFASVEALAEGDVTRARVDSTVVEVERGQYVTPLMEDFFNAVQPKATSAEVAGVVLAVQFDGGVVAGEHQVVFVDKGSSHGLFRGNRLEVVSHGDPYTGKVAGMPNHSIAELMVMQANETASTCLVTQSLREIEPGAMVVSRMQ